MIESLRSIPLVELRRTDVQVLTRVTDRGRGEPAENQGFLATDDALREVGASSIVIRGGSTSTPDQSSKSTSDQSHDDDQGPVSIRDHGGERSTSKKTKKKRRKRKRGGKRRSGWQPSSGLRWRHDVREIDNVAHELGRKGYAFTHLVTIRPYDGDPLTRKRTCSRVVAHLGQALKRRGHRHVGITIIEHPLYGELHAHHLVCVPRSEPARIEEWRDRKADIDIRRITDLRGLLRYVLKQRLRLSPEFEDRIRTSKGPRWQKCRPVPGKRWSMTTDAKVVMTTGAWPAPLPKPSTRHAKRQAKSRRHSER
jgi:hypothetical protein